MHKLRSPLPASLVDPLLGSPSRDLTVISFDIGIKNLAYCVFSINQQSVGSSEQNKNKTSILKWGVANLIPTDTNAANTSHTCNCKKKTKNASSLCGKKATFQHEQNYYCNVHAKTSGKFMPTDFSISSIKKLKLEELKSFCDLHKIPFDHASDKKPDILAKADAFIKAGSLIPIKVEKKNANHVHIVEIGKQIKIQLDEILTNVSIDAVILENQISPIAGRMNTIQGMLAQYFIMRNNIVPNVPSIDFISSSCKLKGFKEAKTDESTYKDHKRDGINICRKFLEKNPEFKKCSDVFEKSPKKDDLADCFLQGIYFLRREKIINYSEDLEINSVSL